MRTEVEARNDKRMEVLGLGCGEVARRGCRSHECSMTGRGSGSGRWLAGFGYGSSAYGNGSSLFWNAPGVFSAGKTAQNRIKPLIPVYSRLFPPFGAQLFIGVRRAQGRLGLARWRRFW